MLQWSRARTLRLKPSSMAFLLYDPERFPNCTCLSLPICEKCLMVTVLTAGAAMRGTL